ALPLPSSPHWAPMRTIAGIVGLLRIDAQHACAAATCRTEAVAGRTVYPSPLRAPVTRDPRHVPLARAERAITMPTRAGRDRPNATMVAAGEPAGRPARAGGVDPGRPGTRRGYGGLSTHVLRCDRAPVPIALAALATTQTAAIPDTAVIDELLPVLAADSLPRLIVLGEDAALAAVLTHLMRTERLHVEIGYVPIDRTYGARA